MIRERTTCRICGSSALTLILDLGKTPLANDFLSEEQLARDEVSLPLRLVICGDCSLAQLGDTVDPEVLYSRYAYVTSTSRTMEAHLEDQSSHLLALSGLTQGAKVLEIASNTGAYLQKFKQKGCVVLGVEPAQNIARVAQDEGIPTRAEFFSAATARRIREEWGAADLIVGRHVFAHIDDLQDLLRGLESVSHDRTLIAFEVPYLVDFFEKTEYDTIYHEHLSYVSVQSIEKLLATTPFMLARVDRYPIHGGSMLFQLRRRGPSVSQHASVAELLSLEARLRLAEPATWRRFATRVQQIREDLPALIRSLRSKGKRIIGYGASAKGNTLLNTTGLTKQDLEYIIDNTPFKQGKVAPGSRLPVRPPDALLEDQPDFALILAWNFAPEIVQRETEYQRRGGRFIVPIPSPTIVEYPA